MTPLTPTDIISDALTVEFPSASQILAALAARGYHVMKHEPCTTVYRSGEMMVM